MPLSDDNIFGQTKDPDFEMGVEIPTYISKLAIHTYMREKQTLVPGQRTSARQEVP